MGSTVVLAVSCVLTALVAAGLLGHLDWLARGLARGWRRLRPQPQVSATICVEQLSADLRRLAAGLERAHHQDQPAKMARLAAASLAYDWVLLSAARTLEVPAPAEAPLDSMDRLQTEAALAACGLDW